MFPIKAVSFGVVLFLGMSPADLASTVRELRGTLYSDEGGPSASGTGEIRIATADSIFSLHYQKPFTKRFHGESCDEIGAIWTVLAYITSPGYGELHAAQCTGEVDRQVHQAWTTARNFMNLAASGEFEAANKLRSSAWRSKHSPTDGSAFSETDLTGYETFGGVRCLQASAPDSKNKVLFDVSENCFVHESGEPVRLRIIVGREGTNPEWRILGVISFSLERVLRNDVEHQ